MADGDEDILDAHDEPQPVITDEDGLEAVEIPQEADEDGLEHVRIDIRRALPNRRLDKYLAKRLGKWVCSRTALQGYIREGNVFVNGRAVKPSYVIQSGDSINISLPAAKPKEIPPEDIPLDIVFEDEDVLAINKQAGLIIHPARGNWTGTLVNGLAFYFRKNWRDISELPTSGEIFRPGIVHRLDRDTTGVILIAKTELALWRLGRQFELRKVHKTYSAIVSGILDRDEDIIDAPIGRHPKIREKYAVHRLTGKPYPSTTKDAITRYKVLKRLRNVGPRKSSFTLVEMYPKTGRTHQLRVHMSFLGHPIVGDKMYGGGPLYRSQLIGKSELAEGPLMMRQALHAHTIEFSHPRTGQLMKLEAPWPPDFTQTLNEIESLAT